MNDSPNRFAKLVDYSLLPFAVVVMSKVIGLYWILNVYGVEWGVAEFPNTLISASPLVFGRDLHVVATYSNLILFLVTFFVFAILLTIVKLRRKAQGDFTVLRRLILSPGAGIINKAWQLYTRMFVWLCFLWLVCLYILYDAVLGRTQWWLVGLSTCLTLAVSYVMYADSVVSSRDVKKLI